jgi:hypothetical protein
MEKFKMFFQNRLYLEVFLASALLLIASIFGLTPFPHTYLQVVPTIIYLFLVVFWSFYLSLDFWQKLHLQFVKNNHHWLYR